MNNPKFQIFKSSANSQFYFRLRAANGEIILGGEGYISKQSCQNGIISVKSNSSWDLRYDKRSTAAGYSFNLLAANGEIVGRSEVYNSSQARDNGIAAVKRDAPNAGIEDLG
ncbi:MAG: YegP family protein [Bacteroidia bacterium]|nr:YegP family protein [Bacteroidia bacterium]